MTDRRKKFPGGQGRGRGWEDKTYTTIWKRPSPPPPPKPTVTVIHKECGTSWTVARGAGAPVCPKCGRI